MPELLKPPTIPLAILNFFRSQPDFPALAGDISEEFYQRVQSSGPAGARRWFWRQAMRNGCALTWRELMRTPVRTSLIALGCLAAVNLISGVYPLLIIYFGRGRVDDLLYDRAVRNVFLALVVIGPLPVGWMGGRLLRGREWALALTFSFFYGLIAAIGTAYFTLVLDYAPLPPTLWTFAILGNALRHGSLWAGCLWARSRSPSAERVDA